MSFEKRENPSEKSCFSACRACFRCEEKGRYAKCENCSGRHDPEVKKEPTGYFDRCRCKEGILQIRLQNGRQIVAKYPHDPFGGTIQTDNVTEDERDWNSYVNDVREQIDDPDWDGVLFEDGGSVTDWTRKQKGGR